MTKIQKLPFAKPMAVSTIIGSQQASRLYKLVLQKYILFDNGFLLALTQLAQPSLHVYYIQVRTSNYVLLVHSTIGSLPIFYPGVEVRAFAIYTDTWNGHYSHNPDPGTSRIIEVKAMLTSKWTSVVSWL